MGTMSEVVGVVAPFDKRPSSPAASPSPSKTPKASPLAQPLPTEQPPSDRIRPNIEPQNKEGAVSAEDGEDSGHGSVESYGPHLRLITANRQVKELQTILRDKNTSRSDFKFYADRLIRLVIEEGLNQLPYGECTIVTPTGCQYQGLQFTKGNCGVSIVRSGEAMEHGLRLCCRSIRIGKILVESDADTHEARVVYAKFPDDISQRKVLLMYPIMSSGNTVVKSMRVLKEHEVEEHNVILLNLFSTPSAARTLTTAFPQMRILTSEVHAVAPNHFGQKYFGTD
ncbi:uracil phosphoribosyltransferase homolog [Hyalella azteca]|uniref:Uracil phosphoribosyltransferase homolog n=1 Tax=Hyalella azteca TaxID=294128 RepID=A0A8B7NJK5_HYAAZ|nr:uracil phosphoribosyltransferase homolog [Hyalella azteca]